MEISGSGLACKTKIYEIPVRNERFSWTIPFDTNFAEPSKIPGHVLFHADFPIRTDPVHHGKLEHFLVKLSSYTAAGFIYRYTFRHKRWVSYLDSEQAAKMHEYLRRDRLGIVRSAWDKCWDRTSIWLEGDQCLTTHPRLRDCPAMRLFRQGRTLELMNFRDRHLRS